MASGKCLQIMLGYRRWLKARFTDLFSLNRVPYTWVEAHSHYLENDLALALFLFNWSIWVLISVFLKVPRVILPYTRVEVHWYVASVSKPLQNWAVLGALKIK